MERHIVRGCACVYDVAEVTILLSQTVFSLLVSHVLTRTSEAVPLIGTVYMHILRIDYHSTSRRKGSPKIRMDFSMINTTK